VKNVLRLQSPSRTTTTCPHCQNPLGPKIRVGAVPTQTIFITSKQLFIIIITLLLNDCVMSLSVFVLWSQFSNAEDWVKVEPQQGLLE
jgi:hypothetical protein